MASHISFVELLGVPTIGISTGQEKTFWELFDLDHARWLDSIIADGARRVIFLSDSVIRKMAMIRKKWGLFPWIPLAADHGLVCRLGATEVHKVHHFSSPGVHGQLDEMKGLIDAVCW